MNKRYIKAALLSCTVAVSVFITSCGGAKTDEIPGSKPGDMTVEAETPVEAPAEAAPAEAAPAAEAPAATEATSTESKTPAASKPAPAAKKEAAKVADKPAAKSNAPAAPEISFERKEYDFGTINQGDKVPYTFKFSNTGNAPLIISDAKASCGCTVPKWPQEPIMPGETGEIDVVFNSAGKSGVQTKSITITTNATNIPEVVYLKGNVNVPEQK